MSLHLWGQIPILVGLLIVLYSQTRHSSIFTCFCRYDNFLKFLILSIILPLKNPHLFHFHLLDVQAQINIEPIMSLFLFFLQNLLNLLFQIQCVYELASTHFFHSHLIKLHCVFDLAQIIKV